jgi:hypothetical protein
MRQADVTFGDAVRAAGGSVDVVDLPAAGIKGNSHMLMMDKNNGARVSKAGGRNVRVRHSQIKPCFREAFCKLLHVRAQGPLCDNGSQFSACSA